ncbi:MAG: deoxyribonuclease IV [Desulfomonile sp.]|nr:deoxyribonuclease IV [Desulfomonile sp.]
MDRKPLLGAHMSIAGGLHLAFERGEAVGCTAIQIFTSNATQWKSKPLSEDDIQTFTREQKRTGIKVVAHDSYLINLGSPDRGLLEQSRRAFLEEMERCERLGIPVLVMHPGSHRGAGEDEGLRTVSQSLNKLLKATAGYSLIVALENTAGQGSALGHSFAHLQRLLSESIRPERLAVCFDTCHAFAAGYDLRTEKSFRRVLEEFDKVVGLNKLKVIHVNDCKKDLGSRVDRHEHIGRGKIGLECFRTLMQEPRFREVPKLMETPKELDGVDMDPVNLGILAKMAAP